jgi:hypothetical protein
MRQGPQDPSPPALLKSAPPGTACREQWRPSCRGVANPRGGECPEMFADPCAYLKDVLERLPTQRASAIDELLPHRWGPTRSIA